MGACGAIFLCTSLFQSVCVRVGDDLFPVATWNSFVIFTRHHMTLLGAFSCRPSVSPEPSAARSRYWYCDCHPQDTAVGRNGTHYSFSSIRTVVYGFSIRSSYYKIQNVSCEIEDFIEIHLCKLRGILRSCMKQNKDAVWYLLGCLLIQSTRTRMIS